MTIEQGTQSELGLFEKPSISDCYSPESPIVLFNGDVNSFLKNIPTGSIKLIITSPPYNLGKEYENEVSLDDYLEQHDKTIDDLVRILHSEGSICWEVGNYVKDSEVFPLDIFYYRLFKKRGLKLRNRVIWHFEHGLHASKRFSGRYETILWFTRSDSYTFNLDSVRVPPKYPGKRHFKGPKKGQPSCNPPGKNPSDIWKVVREDWEKEIWEIPNVKSNHPEKTVHPCQFPIELVQRCVLALTNEGDTVLDPYCGVGSTLLAGLIHNRKVIGCEIQSNYVAIAKERIRSLYAGTLKIRPIGKPIFKPTGK